jgi:hypothetical protein
MPANKGDFKAPGFDVALNHWVKFSKKRPIHEDV